ncbi:acetyl-CoA carboxylase biotin carboxyl carrier protein [Ilyomonas limi]|uniref:Biotin carboxyl carrier protein of acetyl-CoA carboxylase n=1 Tax=Ilyomonas limi TaxID=2575867 RepID=A0A4U3L5V6_9BACT|nr:acetyl-CoA carboxylase biotin carboxyl carrier protein [Ilyomonas limi]TKK69779.1 acetyl-CoA carboxylase biotin carboxyl carrier protein [Ilyomonas limi]
MDFKQIQELIKIVNRSNIGELCIEQNDFKITIKQKEEHQVQTIVAAPQPMAIPQQQTIVPAPMPPTPTSMDAAAAADQPASTKTDNYITIKSPMIGTFYRRPSPDKPIFAEIGDEITPGKVVCIIEAMKLFNEIESEVSGKIVKILVEDASPVEYDQPLFLVEPS